MPPKRAKSGAGSAGPQKWEQALVSTPFIDEVSVWFLIHSLIEMVSDSVHNHRDD